MAIKFAPIYKPGSTTPLFYKFGRVISESPWDGLEKVEMYDSITNSYIPKQNMPIARYNGPAVRNGNYFYIFGGVNDDAAITKIDRYDIANNSWFNINNLLYAREAPATCIVDGIIYLSGGKDNNPRNTIEKYDIANNTISLLSGTMTRSRWGHIMFHYNNKLCNIDYYLDVYDLSNNTCVDKGSLPSSNNFYGGVLYGDKIHIVKSDRIEIYNITNDSWNTVLHSYSFTAKISQGEVSGGKLYIVLANKIVRYNPANYTFTTIYTVSTTDYGFTVGLVSSENDNLVPVILYKFVDGSYTPVLGYWE